MQSDPTAESSSNTAATDRTHDNARGFVPDGQIRGVSAAEIRLLCNRRYAQWHLRES
jgi:hypothetical protein